MENENTDSIVNGRRSFIQSAGTVVIGGALGLNLGMGNTTFAQNKSVIKVGLIGCGGRGTGAASQALKADPNVIITALGDVFQDRLDKAYELLKKVNPERANVPKQHHYIGFDAYQRVLESGVDVVLLATPPGFRPEHLSAAVDAGKHIFCEKPVAVDAPGVRKVLAASKKAKEKGLSLVSGFTFRYDLPKRALFGKVLNGDIGTVRAVTSTRNGGELWYHPRQAGWTEMEYQMRNWYYYNWLSGDFIVEMVVHSLDMMSWALGGKMPLKATGTGGRQVRKEEKWGNIYDHFAIEFDYDNGVKGYNFCRQQDGCSGRSSVEIIGSEGNAYYEGEVHKITGKNEWLYRGEKKDMYQVQHDELFASIRNGKPMNDGEFMANSSMMGILSRMVAYSGQTITWDQAINSNQISGPAFDQYDWNLNWPVPDPAIPGKTKVI
ncbi:MAG: Gfo/Idh/MocA family oxidoreductase [Pedobacter sp.]|jgi:predicted dehydrogenase